MFWWIHRSHRWRQASQVRNHTRLSFLVVSTPSRRIGHLRLAPFRLGGRLEKGINGGDDGVHYVVGGPRKREEMAHPRISIRLWILEGIRYVLRHDLRMVENVAEGGGWIVPADFWGKAWLWVWATSWLICGGEACCAECCMARVTYVVGSTF